MTLSSAILSGRPQNSGDPILSRVKWNIEDISMEVSRDSAIVSYSFILTDEKIAKGYSVVIMPSLECGKDYVPLKPFSIYRGDDRTYRNKLKLQDYTVSGDPREVYIVSGQYHGTVHMSAKVPRKEWMDSCSVFFSVMERSKKAEYNKIDRHLVATLRKPACPTYDPMFSITVPRRDVSSTRTVVIPLYLEFEHNSNAVDLKLGRNQVEIDRFTEDVKSVLKNRYCNFKSASLRCWTSPDGTEKGNQSLTNGRAASVFSYLNKKGVFCGKTVTPIGMGEDWLGMVSWLRGSSLSMEPQLLEMLDAAVGHDDTEKRIRNEKARVWEILERQCFPSLRRFELVLNMEPLGFDNTSILQEVCEHEPRLLSPMDFWKLSRLYPETSSEWCNVFLEAAELYPNDEVCNLNAAAAMLSTGSYREASLYLSRSGDSDTSRYLQAVWMLGTDRFNSAIDLMKTLVTSENSAFASAFSRLISIKNWHDDRVLWNSTVHNEQVTKKQR